MDGRHSSFAPGFWAHGEHSDTQMTRMPEAERVCMEHPEMPQCQAGIYSYVLNKHANTAFLLLFLLLMFPMFGIVGFKRRGHLYSAAMFTGLIFEALGYSARCWSQANQLQSEPFYMQIVCLTVGPAFLAAAIYLCMRRIVVCFDPMHSLVGPESYTCLFIPCDLVSLILQATGGAIAASAHKAKDQATLDKGTNVMIAGLAFQVFTMFVFGFLGLAFLRNVRADHRRRIRDGNILDPAIEAIRDSLLFKAFTLSIIGATLLIFARCCYRVAELSGGWKGSLMKNQTLFIICEGVYILLASVLLIIAHPALTAPVVLGARGEGGFIRERLNNLCCFGGGENGPDEEIRLSSVTTGVIKEGPRATTGPAEVPLPETPQHEPLAPIEDLSAQAFSRRESQPNRAVPSSSQPLSKGGLAQTKFKEDYLRACLRGDIERINKELADRPYNLECQDWAGNRPLHIAARSGHHEIVKLLIDNGCDVQAPNLDRDTPLLVAAENNHLQVVRLLLAAGANPHQTSLINKKPLDVVKGDSETAVAMQTLLLEAEAKWKSTTDQPPHQR